MCTKCKNNLKYTKDYDDRLQSMIVSLVFTIAFLIASFLDKEGIRIFLTSAVCVAIYHGIKFSKEYKNSIKLNQEANKEKENE